MEVFGGHDLSGPQLGMDIRKYFSRKTHLESSESDTEESPSHVDPMGRGYFFDKSHLEELRFTLTLIKFGSVAPSSSSHTLA